MPKPINSAVVTYPLTNSYAPTTGSTTPQVIATGTNQPGVYQLKVDASALLDGEDIVVRFRENFSTGGGLVHVDTHSIRGGGLGMVVFPPISPVADFEIAVWRLDAGANARTLTFRVQTVTE